MQWPSATLKRAPSTPETPHEPIQHDYGETCRLIWPVLSRGRPYKTFPDERGRTRRRIKRSNKKQGGPTQGETASGRCLTRLLLPGAPRARQGRSCPHIVLQRQSSVRLPHQHHDEAQETDRTHCNPITSKNRSPTSGIHPLHLPILPIACRRRVAGL
jgi:hypothetical protein